MKQTVRVQKLNGDGTARVLLLRQSACSGDCHQCSGCGAVQETLTVDARNPIGAKPGELVRISAGSGPVLAAAAVLYLMPVVLFFGGYALGAALWKVGALTGCLAFLAGVFLAVAYDRLVARKQKTTYTITEFADGAEFLGNEGNHID